MNGAALLEKMELVNPAFVEEADRCPAPPKRGRAGWTALAACLVLLAVSAPFIRNLVLAPKGQWLDSPSDPLQIFEYGGAYYELVDDPALLERYGLPHAPTADAVGRSLGTATAAGGTDELIFYQYLPWADIRTDPDTHNRPQRAAYAVQQGDDYAFALFCNFIPLDSNAHTEAAELLAVYGIDSAVDIAYILVGKEKITDPDVIAAAYNALTGGLAMGNDDFQKLVFSGKSEEEQQRLATTLADSMVPVRIAAKTGPVTGTLHYYPSHHLVSWALSYYRLNAPLV